MPVTLGDVATIQIGPEIRRGIAELDGEGEVAGGIVVLRQGADARSAISAVEAKLKDLKKSSPPGVEIVTTYDRSQLIDHAIENPDAQARRGVRRGCAGLCAVPLARPFGAGRGS